MGEVIPFERPSVCRKLCPGKSIYERTLASIRLYEEHVDRIAEEVKESKDCATKRELQRQYAMMSAIVDGINDTIIAFEPALQTPNGLIEKCSTGPMDVEWGRYCGSLCVPEEIRTSHFVSLE